MELRRNITLSVIVHAAIVMTISAFAGRNSALPRLPENYIAVSLLEYAEEKKSASADTIKENSEKPETKSQGGPLSLPDPKRIKDTSTREVPPNNEQAVPFREPENDPAGEAKAVRESQYLDTSVARALHEAREEPVSLQVKPTESGSGENRPAASSSGVRTIMPGNSVAVGMTGSHPAGGGAGTDNIINQIKASIERAKRYPIFARERGQEGTVVTEFSINGKGRPENIRVVKSSGFNLLDRAAKDTVIRAAPFPLVSAPVTVNITFNIDVGRPGRR